MMDTFSGIYEAQTNHPHHPHMRLWCYLMNNMNLGDKVERILYRWYDYELYRWKVCHCYH